MNVEEIQTRTREIAAQYGEKTHLSVVVSSSDVTVLCYGATFDAKGLTSGRGKTAETAFAHLLANLEVGRRKAEATIVLDMAIFAVKEAMKSGRFPLAHLTNEFGFELPEEKVVDEIRNMVNPSIFAIETMDGETCLVRLEKATE
jgi:hypothetical protein